ncbi:SH3 domain-containing protein [Thermodesulfobacteriota bacterium]
MKFFSIFVSAVIILSNGFAWAERLTVKASVANIRSGPETSYEILWNAEKFYPIVVIEKTGPWYHFRDFEGDEGWIHKSLVGKFSAVITTKPKCNIRAGPGTDFEILFSVESGVPFKVLKRKGNWIFIQHSDGDKGWIHKSLTW